MAIRGVGQRPGNEGTYWGYISVPMMEITDQLTPGCIINLPHNTKTWSIKILGFVNDKTHYTDLLRQTIKESISEIMTKSVNMQEKLLSFIGGKLKHTKCSYYLLEWESDKKETPNKSGGSWTISNIEGNIMAEECNPDIGDIKGIHTIDQQYLKFFLYSYSTTCIVNSSL